MRLGTTNQELVTSKAVIKLFPISYFLLADNGVYK